MLFTLGVLISIAITATLTSKPIQSMARQENGLGDSVEDKFLGQRDAARTTSHYGLGTVRGLCSVANDHSSSQSVTMPNEWQMPAAPSNRQNPSSVPALRRLAFRLVTIVAFAALWPAPSVAGATAILCVALAVGCLVAAHVLGEPIGGGALNRWDEAAILIAIAYLVLLFL